VQHAGEVLFIPSYWEHATRNYGLNVGLANTMGEPDDQEESYVSYRMPDEYPLGAEAQKS